MILNVGNTAELKQKNMLSLIQALYVSRVATKPELAKSLKLTLPTVHNFINELAARGIAAEDGVDVSKGGRRAVRYSFNGGLYNLLGVRVTPRWIDIGLFDALLNTVRQDQYHVCLEEFTSEEGMQLVISYIKDTLARWNVDREKLLDIGITFPGPVDYASGVILKLPNLRHWENIPARAILERDLGHKVIVEKDSFSNVIGLKWLNQTAPDSTVVFLVVGIGVGVGFLHRGQLYRGKNNMMGEIGHVCIEPQGPLCKCGGRGCLELYASDIGIVKRVSERVKKGESPLLEKMSGGTAEHIDMEMILAAERQGDQAARLEMEFSLRYIAECIVNIIKLYDPDKVIIGHYWLAGYPGMIAKVYEFISLHSFFLNKNTVSIEFNKIANLELVSAAAIVLEHQFSSMEHSRFLALLK